MRIATWHTFLGMLALGALAGEAVAANPNIRGNLRGAPGLVGLQLDERYRNAVDALTEYAARQIPIPASSSGFTYRYDPETGRYERSSGALGPMPFVERPQTLGRGVWSVGVTGQYLELDEFDGNKVGKDPFPILAFSTAPTRPGNVVTTFSATPKPIYHLATINVTYGLTDDLDLNLALPLAAVDFDINASRQDAGSAFVSRAADHGHVSLNIADILLRAKYRLYERHGWAAAAGFIARLPTGDPARALGTGDGEIGPYVALSTLLWGRVEPQWNVGFDLALADTHQSSAHYAFGVNILAASWLDLGISTLGRSEVDERRALSSVSGPHQTAAGVVDLPYEGVNTDRKDYFDLTFGARFRLTRSLALMLSGVYALNDAGLRSSGVSPLGGLEATF